MTGDTADIQLDDRPREKAKPMTVRRQVKRLAIMLAIVYAALCAIAIGYADRVMFHPHAAKYTDGQGVVKLRTADGMTISAIHTPNPSAKYTILYSHGNGEDMGDDREETAFFRSLGFAVLAYDYHGYGTSQGTPSEDNCYHDIDAAYEYLTVTLKVPPDRILLLGKSVGSGPSVDLATRKPIAGLVLQSAFTSAFHTHWVGYLVPGDRFRNIDKIGLVKCPVLVIHGRQDWVVPFAHGQQLFAAANEPKRCLWVDGGNHNDLPEIGGKRYDQALMDFAKLVQSGRK